MILNAGLPERNYEGISSWKNQRMVVSSFISTSGWESRHKAGRHRSEGGGVQERRIGGRSTASVTSFRGTLRRSSGVAYGTALLRLSLSS